MLSASVFLHLTLMHGFCPKLFFNNMSSVTWVNTPALVAVILLGLAFVLIGHSTG